MKSVSKHPYTYFFGSAIIIFLIGTEYIIRNYLIKYSTININIHDTYFVISHFDFSKIVASIFLLIGFIYLYLYTWNFNLSKILVKIHTILSISCFLVFYFGWFYFEMTHSNKFPLFNNQSKENALNILVISIFIIAQIIFILNLMHSLIKKVMAYKL